MGHTLTPASQFDSPNNSIRELMIFPIFQMRKRRQREVKWPSHSHTVSKKWRWVSDFRAKIYNDYITVLYNSNYSN